MRTGWIPVLFVTLLRLALCHSHRLSFVDHQQALTDHGIYHSSESGTISFIRKRHLSRRSDHLNNEEHTRSAIEHLKILLPSATFEVLRDSYSDSDTGVSHIYLAQTYTGLRIANSQANVNVLRDGTIFSAGLSYNLTEGIYLDTSIINSSRRFAPLSALETLKGVVKKLKLPIDMHKAYTDEVDGDSTVAIINFSLVKGVTEQPTASLVTYYHKGRLVWVWRLYIAMNENVLQVMADAHKKARVYSVSDHVKDIGYRVYPFGSQNYTASNHILVQDPQKLQYSRLGWHTFGPSNSLSPDQSVEFNSTVGNNAIAIDSRGWIEPEDDSDHAMWSSRSQAKATKLGPVFDFPHDPEDPDGKNKYVDSGIVHAFYIVNCYHDLLYSLGFTPASGNFEETNLAEGGYGGDAVLIKVLWDNTTNNAFFYTPIDGSNGPRKRPVMTLLPFKTSSIQTKITNSAFDSNIIIHEYTHGLSTRLVGGPRRSCLHSMESGALGEAWSDFFAVAIHLQPGDTRYTPQYIGLYASQSPRGLRKYPYSSDMKANPMTFGTLNNQTELSGLQISFLHHMGTLMANILLEMMWNLIDKHGRQKDIFPIYKKGTAVPTKGVQLAMRLVVESFKLSSCEPTFLSARDTVLDADRLLTGGENQCEIWKAFAKRGMGIKASQYKNSKVSVTDELNSYDRTVRWIRVENSELPKECR